MTQIFDIAVIGAGHAGIEAACISAKMGLKTVLLNFSMETLGVMSCNPAIGGLAKGHLVREIDALGGVMAEVIDATGIQFRMLNRTKGPAVWGPRAQADKEQYRLAMTEKLLHFPGLTVLPDPAAELILSGKKVTGVKTESGKAIGAGAVIITTGTFLNGVTHRGDQRTSEGRIGERPSIQLAEYLRTLDLKIGRLKTGTPCRLHRDTLDYSKMDAQEGDADPIPFSFATEKISRSQILCHITYTSEETRKIVRENLHLSALYGGHIQGVGPRYCPSIEDKYVKFADKERHMIFVEPEGKESPSVYINGASSSLPAEIQAKMIHSITGLERAEILRTGYAIEYDFVQPTELHPTYETKHYENLYLAGQINGTSGYEEAAAQGFLAGVNAVLKLGGKSPLIIKRSEGYMGVMTDDLVTRGVDEPYRLFTSRAEYRLILRQDTADFRLTEKGYQIGSVKEDAYQRMCDRKKRLEEVKSLLDKTKREGKTLSQWYITQSADEETLPKMAPEIFALLKPHDEITLFADLKYGGYMEKEYDRIQKASETEDRPIPGDLDYTLIKQLRVEARQKLSKIRPLTQAQARNIPGITPADLQVLFIGLEKLKKEFRRAN